MFRMTKTADYGIVLLSYFARDPERDFHSARGLAAEAGLPLPTVSKILKGLARASLLESQRGANGGYRLARDPVSISVAEIITAVEGPIGVTECITGASGDCELETSCPVRSPWQRVNTVVRTALGEVSLAEMIRPDGRRRPSLALSV